MTDQEIKDTVEGWDFNLGIFEIYDEVKDMSSYVGYSGNDSSQSNLSRLLNHAYEYFKHDPMIKELMSFLGVEIAEESLCEEHGRKDLTTTS